MERNPNDRLVMFSDAVIAITITLLVLELRVPAGVGELTSPETWAALIGLWPRFLAYLISFAVIAAYWVSHKGKFDRIVGGDAGITWLNMLFLLMIGLVPFTTALISEAPGPVGTAVYAGTMSATGFVLGLIWVWAWARGYVDPDTSLGERRRILLSNLLFAIVFAASIAIAFVNADAAKYAWLALIPIVATSRGFSRRRKTTN